MKRAFVKLHTSEGKRNSSLKVLKPIRAFLCWLLALCQLYEQPVLESDQSQIMPFLIKPAEIFQVKVFIVQEHHQVLSCPFLTWQRPMLLQNCFKYTDLIILFAALSD